MTHDLDPEAPTGQILSLLVLVMQDVTEVGKESLNRAQGFKFRGIDAVLNAVGPALRTHCIVPVPLVMESTYQQVDIGKDRTPMGFARLTVRYRFYACDGSYIDAVVPGEAMDSGDKATSKAMSVAYRTALIQVLALPTGDPDPDHDVYERSQQEEPAEQKAPKQRGTRRRQDQQKAPTQDEIDDLGTLIVASDDFGEIKRLYHRAHLAGVTDRKPSGIDHTIRDLFILEITDQAALPNVTGDTLRELWNLAKTTGVIAVEIPSTGGTLLGNYLKEKGETVDRREEQDKLTEAANSDNAVALVGAATDSWQETEGT